MLSDVLDFVFPAQCAVCGEAPSPICHRCVPSAGIYRSSFQGLPVWYCLEYQAYIAAILKAYKDQARLSLLPCLGGLWSPALTAAVSTLSPDLITAPARNRQNYIRRGFDPVGRLFSATKMPGAKKDLRLIRFERKIKDQRKLSASARQKNVAGSMHSKPGSGSVLLIDDVMTTGATVAECIRALQSAGYEVIGICVLAKRIL